MAFTEKFNLNWKDIAGEALLREIDLTGDGLLRRSVPLLDTETDKAVDLVLDVSQISLLYMVSSVVMTFETNNAGVPVDTINFLAGVPVMFWTGCGYLITDLISTDVTALFLTTAGAGAGGVFELRCVLDTTP